MNTKENLARGEKTVATKSDLLHLKRKKSILILLILATVLFAGLIVIAKFSPRVVSGIENISTPTIGVSSVGAGSAPAAGEVRSEIYPNPAMPGYNGQNQFVLPEDAAENGELSIGVSNLDEARKKMAIIAQGSGGNVYFTNITYASNSIKKGVLVLQVPVGQFAKTFEALKSIASQVYRESTQKISPRNLNYPMPMSQGAGSSAEFKNVDEGVVQSSDASGVAVGSEPATQLEKSTPAQTDSVSAIAINPIYYPQTVQDKGYIKVTFLDSNDNLKNVTPKNTNKNIFGLGQGTGKIVWLGLLLKAVFLVLLIALLLLLIIKSIKLARRPKPTITRQLSKSRKAAVKIKKK